MLVDFNGMNPVSGARLQVVLEGGFAANHREINVLGCSVGKRGRIVPVQEGGNVT